MVYDSDLEEDLNKVIMDLVAGFDALAASLKKGESRSVLADQLQTLARSVCEHWPDCRSREEEESGS